MQGTKQDLWNSVPPNMAKRVLAGMLNETLSILTVRYAQVVPSQSRFKAYFCIYTRYSSQLKTLFYQLLPMTLFFQIRININSFMY